MLAFDGLLEATEPRGHTVQLYGSDASLLARSVRRYLRQALDAGKTAIVVATPSHSELFARDLTPADEARVTFLDADSVLDSIMVEGRPDPARFRKQVGTPIHKLATANPQGVRAYGEMVGILWERDQREAAAGVEDLWNDLMQSVDFELFCAYPIDVFSTEFQMSTVDEIMCGHSHLRPARRNNDLLEALRNSIDRVLGARAARLAPLMKPNNRPAWGAVPSGEALILWLRNNLPEDAEKIIATARVDFLKSAGSPA